MRWIRLFSLLVCVSLIGCANLLPRSTADAPSPFSDFASAQLALEKIVPFVTAIDELPALGFDPRAGSNVLQIPYPEIAVRLAPNPGVPLDAMDSGVRRCLLAQTACRGYLFRYGEHNRTRLGDFWLDFLNIRRITQITGWQFEALVVVSDGVVLFRNFGGEPKTEKSERQFNPLGPFQPTGESAGRSLLR